MSETVENETNGSPARNSYEEEAKRIAVTIGKMKHRIAVFSGKGGVGKTTVSVNLAYALQSEGYSTGILDADITGPNVPKMLGVDEDINLDGNVMIPFEKYGAKMMSFASLIKNGQALIWRGPMRSKVINQFLADVNWGELDYLVADLPPGTGDEMLTIGQETKPDYAVIVTTPQEVALLDAERTINMAQKLEIPNIGVVENMSGFVCPHCNNVVDVFGSGGGKDLAEKYNVEFLGAVPLDPLARELGDKGTPIVLNKPESEVSKAFTAIADKISKQLDQ